MDEPSHQSMSLTAQISNLHENGEGNGKQKENIRLGFFRMSLKYIYFNFIWLKLSACFFINFALTEISCQASVYSLITFFLQKRGKRNNNKFVMQKLQVRVLVD